MALLALIMAAAAAETGDLIPGKVIIGLFSAIFAAGGGIWIGRKGGESAAEKSWAKREEDLRAQITNELKVKADIPQPLEIELKDKFVSRREFDQHCQASDSALKAHISDNERNFEALYGQMRANDKLTAKISGCLEAIQGDLSLIKTKLFGGKK